MNLFISTSSPSAPSRNCRRDAPPAACVLMVESRHTADASKGDRTRYSTRDSASGTSQLQSGDTSDQRGWHHERTRDEMSRGRRLGFGEAGRGTAGSFFFGKQSVSADRFGAEIGRSRALTRPCWFTGPHWVPPAWLLLLFLL
jgi:hypothetical protein